MPPLDGYYFVRMKNYDGAKVRQKHVERMLFWDGSFWFEWDGESTRCPLVSHFLLKSEVGYPNDPLPGEPEELDTPDWF